MGILSKGWVRVRGIFLDTPKCGLESGNGERGSGIERIQCCRENMPPEAFGNPERTQQL